MRPLTDVAREPFFWVIASPRTATWTVGLALGKRGLKAILWGVLLLLFLPQHAAATVPCFVNNQLHECTAAVPTLSTYRFDVYGGAVNAYISTGGESVLGPLALVEAGERYIEANAIPLFISSLTAQGNELCPPPSTALIRQPEPQSYYLKNGYQERLRYIYAYGPWGRRDASRPADPCSQFPAGTISGQVSAGRGFSCPAGFALRPDAPEAEQCSRPLRPEGHTCPAAYPVQPDTGVKRLDETDYAGAGAHPLLFARSYRSSHSLLRPGRQFGLRWSTSFGAHLERGQTYTSVHRSDGSALSFRSDAGTTWQSAWGPRATLSVVTDAGGALTGWTLQLDDDSVETFDAAGVLLSIRERNGWTTTLTYSGAATPAADYLTGTTLAQPGRLISVRNQFGRELKLVYDAAGQLVQLIPPGAVKDGALNTAQAPIRYGYDVRGNLTTVTWQDGTVKRYHYEDTRPANTLAEFASLLTGITDESNTRIANYAYDDQGRATLSERGSDRYLFSYGGSTGTNGSSAYVTAPDGSTRTYTFEVSGGIIRPSAVTAPCPLCGNTQKSTVYDVAGNVSKAVAHDGTVSFYAYDSKGRETERATFASSYASAATRPALANATKVFSTKWHATFNLPTQVAEPNKTTANTYNSKGMLTGKSWTATTDATGAAKFTAAKTGSTFATGWGYSASSLATTVIEKVDATEAGRWTVTYKTDGNINKITDTVSGQSATLTNDSAGLITKITAGNGAMAAFTGNTRGQMIKAITPRMTTDFSIDALGLTNEIRFGDGRWIRYTYNASRRIIKITDSNGQVEQYAGLEPSWFLDEKTIRTAAMWLSMGGKRFASMLIPEAKAQTSLILPAGIIFGLVLIFEGSRRNSASSSGSATCCGQDGTPGFGGGDETLASRWSRQITTLLSDQTMPAQSAPAPIYDKAGLLVSPKACVPPPGNCDPNKHRDMQEEVNNACKGQARRCGGGLSRVDLIQRLEQNRSCAIARDKINKTCFAGGDKDHRDQAIDAWSSVTRCEDFLSRVP